MKITRMVRGWVIALALVGLTVPQMAYAAGSVAPAAARSIAPAAVVVDVALHDGGVLLGQVVGPQGTPQAGSQVALRQQGEVVASAVTNEEGRFAISGLRGGIYEIETAQGGGVYRAWAPHTAPPAALKSALVVSDEDVVRGQMFNCCHRPWLVCAALIGVAGVVGGVIGYNIRKPAS